MPVPNVTVSGAEFTAFFYDPKIWANAAHYVDDTLIYVNGEPYSDDTTFVERLAPSDKVTVECGDFCNSLDGYKPQPLRDVVKQYVTNPDALLWLLSRD